MLLGRKDKSEYIYSVYTKINPEKTCLNFNSI